MLSYFVLEIMFTRNDCCVNLGLNTFYDYFFIIQIVFTIIGTGFETALIKAEIK